MTASSAQASAVQGMPDIPSKRYLTIGEVSELCRVKAHVLRYWEQEFPQLRPTKRRGNRRYYQRADVEVVCRIRSLLYDQGYTINGARQRMGQGPEQGPETPAPGAGAAAPLDVDALIAELNAVLDILRAP